MTNHTSLETAPLTAAPAAGQAQHTSERPPANPGVPHPLSPARDDRGNQPRRPIRAGQMTLGMSAAVLGQPLIYLLALTVSHLGPADAGPPAFGLAELLLIIGCLAGARKARAAGNRSLAAGLLAGWAVTAALALTLYAVALAAAMYSFAHSS